MTELEVRLRDALASLLATEPESIPITAHFGEIGVDSLTALRFVRQVVELTGIEIDIECVLENPSIAQLTRYLEIYQDPVALSPSVQERMP